MSFIKYPAKEVTYIAIYGWRLRKIHFDDIKIFQKDLIAFFKKHLTLPYFQITFIFKYLFYKPDYENM